MAKRTTYVCNICGKDKQATNHWWIAYVPNGGAGLMISPWSDALADNEQVKTLCGQECVIKAVSEYMQRQQLGYSIVYAAATEKVSKCLSK